MTAFLRSGDLDRRIDLSRTVLLPHPETNEALETLVVYASGLPSAFRQMSGREFLSGAQVLAERRGVFVVRWRSDVLVTDQVTFEGQRWDVLEVREIGRRVGLELHAKAVL